MTHHVQSEYCSAGGNRNSGAADWSTTSGLLAFGADQNVAFWSPGNESGHGIIALCQSHTAKVTAVKFLTLSSSPSTEVLVTGCAKGEILLWTKDESSARWYCSHKVKAHKGTVNAIACLNPAGLFATGGADGKFSIWKPVGKEVQPVAELLLKPKFIPLALATGLFESDETRDNAFLVVGGTKNDVQVYSLQNMSTDPKVNLCATLTGHEGWIRSLALTPKPDGGYLLASASQDKYVRLWRLTQTSSKTIPSTNGTSTTAAGTLAAKVQSVSAGTRFSYAIGFEALLLGHEDWIYSAAWSSDVNCPRLLTASADGSLATWEADSTSGIWISVSRLGEISAQKGATTATGSSGGFWTGMWSPDGKSIAALGRTGSWRLWQYDEATHFWNQRYGITGHIGAVTGISWSPDGSYLLSTSSDQTTRLYAEWKRSGKRSWHEFSRPQIHGYDLNCVASISARQFSSGADEKLLRVFNEPRDVADMLYRLCSISLPGETGSMPDRAAIPVLGLSNKAMDGEDSEEVMNGDAPEQLDGASTTESHGTSPLSVSEPPTEDLLSRHTLWPEHEKLYGHGSEISEAVTSSHGDVLATAGKASSVEQAVIRLYDTITWNEIKPLLSAHSLTVTRLAFSPKRTHNEAAGEYLLSVGRDRQWTLFHLSTMSNTKTIGRSWTLVANNPKAHSRMILDATWLDTPRPAFVTAGRDKTVKIWSRRAIPDTTEADEARQEFTLQASITRKSPVTAIAATSYSTRSILAVGEDTGIISLYVIREENEMRMSEGVEVPLHLCPSSTVNRLAWRPGIHEDDEADEKIGQLAIASADGSVRILRVDLGELLRT